MATIVIKDKNLVPQNIKRGVTILKVTGTLDASGGGSVNLQEKTVNSSTVSQNVTPSQGYDGLSKVTVNPYQLDSKTVDASTVSQTVTSSADGLSSVTVNPYTLDSKTVDPSTSQVTVNSSADGLSSVTVTAVTSSIDQNISAGNIKKDVTILGVTGTFEGGSSAPVLQDVSVSYSQNGEYTLSASSGYDGLGTVDISVNIPSQGGEPWYIQAKKGQITDVSNCSFGGLVNYDYGAAYMLTGSGITTLPILPDTSVANSGMKGTFMNCQNLNNQRVDISLNSVGGEAFAQAFLYSNITDVSIFVENYANQSFSQAFLGCYYIDTVTINGSTLGDDSGNDIAAFEQAFGAMNEGRYHMADVTIDATNILNGNLFGQAFYASRIRNLSIANATTIHPYAFAGALTSNAQVQKLIAKPNLFYDSNEDYWGPITGEAWDIYAIELNANATENMYFRWQDKLSASSVYNILTHLDLTISGKEVVFFGGYYWDDEAGEDVWKQLKIYDFPDGRVLTAYNAAVNAGWTISNLTIETTNTSWAGTHIAGPVRDLNLRFGINTNNTVMKLNFTTYPTNERHNIMEFVSADYLSLFTGNSLGTWGISSGNESATLNNYYDDFNYQNLRFGVRADNKLYFSTGSLEAVSQNTVDLNTPISPIHINDIGALTALEFWENWDNTSTGGSDKVLVHELVPARFGDNKTGLYDTVDGVAYTGISIIS